MNRRSFIKGTALFGAMVLTPFAADAYRWRKTTRIWTLNPAWLRAPYELKRLWCADPKAPDVPLIVENGDCWTSLAFNKDIEILGIIKKTSDLPVAYTQLPLRSSTQTPEGVWIPMRFGADRQFISPYVEL